MWVGQTPVEEQGFGVKGPSSLWTKFDVLLLIETNSEELRGSVATLTVPVGMVSLCIVTSL